MNLVTGRFEFRPRLVPAVATLILFPVLMALGFWQLDRADQKERLVAELASRSVQPVVTTASLNDDATLRYRQAEISGEFLADRQLLLDNQVRAGSAGYLVYTPLRLEGREQVLLVNRGWITAGPSRDVLPEVTAPAGLVRLQGVLDFPPRPGIRLGDTVVVTDRWPLVMLELDSVLLSARLGAEVLPLSLLITHDADTRLLQDDVRGRDFKPERHLGYAVQWFGLALALIVIFLAVNTRAGEVRHEDRG